HRKTRSSARRKSTARSADYAGRIRQKARELKERQTEICSTLRWSKSCNRFVIIGMSADDLLRPNKFSESRLNDPQRNTSCDQRVEKRMSGDGEQESRKHRSKGDINVA